MIYTSGKTMTELLLVLSFGMTLSAGYSTLCTRKNGALVPGENIVILFNMDYYFLIISREGANICHGSSHGGR